MEWEYRAVPLNLSDEDSLKDLEALGEQGFELVVVHNDYFVFKRPKPQAQTSLGH